MSLTVAQIRAFPVLEKSYKKADAKGLYIEVYPNGSKHWRYKYRIAGKEKRLTLGPWPEVSLAEARIKRDRARSMLADGIDPSMERKKEKASASLSAANTFGGIAEEYIEQKMAREDRAPATLRKARWFLDLLRPAIGQIPISDIEPQTLLAPLKKLEAKGNLETAKKCRSFASRVFRYGAATGRCSADPAAILRGALISPKAKHYAAILEPAKFGGLLRAIDGFDGSPTVKIALQISPHVFVRPGELRHAEWDEIDLDAAIWNIPAGKMKARRAHSVPLSTQVLELILHLQNLTGNEGYLFPALHTKLRPMSENTANSAFRRMGFSKEEVTAHGLRATASSFLNESGLWNADAIERALAHGDSDATRGAYHRGNYWQERVKMAQWWSDYLDQLRVGATILPIAGRERI